MDCKDFDQYSSAYLDKNLTEEEKQAFEKHIGQCPFCEMKYENLKTIISSINETDEVPLPKNFNLELNKKIKTALPYSSITTDIIVGFPGETEEDFNETLDVVKECKYDSAFTFIFSPRVGTPAANMDDNVSLEKKNNRLHKLNELVNSYAKEANDKYLGKIVPVLIEGISEKDKNKLVGYTDTMKLVNVIGDVSNVGKIVDVEITEAKTWSLDGKIK